MKKATAVAMFLAIFLSLVSMAHASMEAFDSGTDGWKTFLTDGSTYSWQAATYNPSGGNPGGYLSGSVGSNVVSRFYSFEAPSSPFGNLTGQTLSVDLMTSGTVTTTAGTGPAMARFYIGSDSTDYFVSTNDYSISLNGSGGWTTYTVQVNSTDFMAWPGQTGTDSLAYVAANAVWVGLVFTAADFSAADNDGGFVGLTSANGAVVRIDNVGTPNPAPIPPAILLLAPGVAGLAAIRRKWKQ